MKKLAVALLSFVLSAAMLTGCSQQEATLEGTWISDDGCTLTLSEGYLTLTDSMGESMLAADQLAYEHRGDFIYMDINGTEVKVFEADLDGNDLTLTYTVEVQADMQTTAEDSIELTRSQD